MVRTLVAICILVVATLFLPFWLQVVLYVVAIFLIRYRLWLLMPAMLADAWYAPVRDSSLRNNKTTLIVLGMLALYLLIISNTRITEHYGLEKK